MTVWPALARSDEAKNKVGQQKLSVQHLDQLLCVIHVFTRVALLQIKDSKMLCVGAGGIGCELLKTLVLTGFVNIHVVCLT